jgi:large subunit ribosomal protein L31
MKPDIHPNYRFVVFKDIATGHMYLTRSSLETKATVKYTDGKEYPLYEAEISAASHPFYTGKQQLVDIAGRVERFNKKYGVKK